MSETIHVEVEQDHLERLVHASQPIGAISELVWNAVDADADQVRIAVIENELEGIDAVRVEDNGSGMTFEEARTEFGHLGGSWKRLAERTRTDNRILHGREGQGRWRAYALGGRVTWISVADDESRGGRAKIEIQGRRTNLGRFTITEPEVGDFQLGTTVLVDQMTESPEGLTGGLAVARLTAEFATYLEQYPVEIVYRGTLLDPTSLQLARHDYQLAIPTDESQTATLTVIEWSQEVDRALYLCDSHGTALERLRAGIQAPGFDFTAYLKWEGFRERHDELGLTDAGVPGLIEIVESARDTLREHFKVRTGEATKALIQKWKDEQVYPYSDEPSTSVEAAGQDLFDVVALAAASAVNRSDDAVSKRLTLGLIREALEQSPTSLRRVLQKVLDLSDEKLDEFDELLSRTPLTSVIAAARKVADRLDFLASLDLLLFESESRRTLLERRQLHRVLAGETWIFGEEFSLMADDQSLTQVLRSHVALLKRTELTPERPVLDADEKVRIVDLAFGRALRLNTNRREHLVVELKRPNLVLGSEELAQVENYAVTVAKDERFDKTDTTWDFFLVGNSYDELVEVRTSQTNKPPGLASESGNIRVWVKTWSQLISEADHRLKFVQEALQYIPTEDQAVEYLRRTHGKYLPEALTG